MVVYSDKEVEEYKKIPRTLWERAILPTILIVASFAFVFWFGENFPETLDKATEFMDGYVDLFDFVEGAKWDEMLLGVLFIYAVGMGFGLCWNKWKKGKWELS